MSDTNPGRKKTWPFLRYSCGAEGFDVSLEEQSQLPGLVVIMTVSNNNVRFFYDWWKSGYQPCGRVRNFLQDYNHSDWSSQTGMHKTVISMMRYVLTYWVLKRMSHFSVCWVVSFLGYGRKRRSALYFCCKQSPSDIFLLLLLDCVPDIPFSSSLDSVTFGPV